MAELVNTTNNMAFHERVKALLDAATKLQDDVKEFADSVTTPNIAATVDETATLRDVPAQPAQPVAHVEPEKKLADVKESASDVSKIAGDINIDDLLAQANIGDMSI